MSGRCIRKQLTDNDSKAVSLPICRIFCGDDPGTIWPKPTGTVQVKNFIARINIDSIRLNVLKRSKINQDFWKANEDRFLGQTKHKVPKSVKLDNQGIGLVININVTNPDDILLTLDTQEEYVLSANEIDGNVLVQIDAITVFGARHALETLSQLVVFDDIRSELQVLAFLHGILIH